MNRIKEFFSRLGFFNPPLSAGYDCAICFDTLSVEDGHDNKLDLRPLDCGHVFHKSCLARWIYHKNACPVCRRPAISCEEEPQIEEQLEEVERENNPDGANASRSPLARRPLSTYRDRMAEQESLRWTMDNLDA